MDIKEVEKEYCSRCPSYKYGCGFITRGLQDKCSQLSDYVEGYERGYEQAKKEMVAEAIYGKVVARFPLASNPRYVDAEIYLSYAKDLKEGSEVKVIVIKED